MSAQAQPDAMPFLKMRLDGIVCLEPTGLSPSTVISAGNDVTLRAELGFDGLFAPLLIGQTFRVVYHPQRIEDNVNVPVLASPITAITAANLAHLTVSAGPFTTVPGGNLPVAPGFASGTYRIVAHVHFTNPAIDTIVTAFYDGLMLMVS